MTGKREILVIKGKIRFKNTDKIGKSNSNVYKGKYYKNGYLDASSEFIKVAVKEVKCNKPEEETAEDVLKLKKLRHPNVVELYHVEYDHNSR